jgi:hypothetical protein
MIRNKAALVLATATLLLSTTSAQAAGYVGAAIGQSEVDVSGYDRATSWQFYGGADLSRYVGLEAAYTNLGQFDVTGVPNTHIQVDGFEFTLVGNLPMSGSAAIFAEAGLYSWNADATLFGTKIGSDNGSDLTYGVGIRMGMARSLRMHLEYQVYTNVSDADINTVSAGLAFGF